LGRTHSQETELPEEITLDLAPDCDHFSIAVNHEIGHSGPHAPAELLGYRLRHLRVLGFTASDQRGSPAVITLTSGEFDLPLSLHGSGAKVAPTITTARSRFANDQENYFHPGNFLFTGPPRQSFSIRENGLLAKHGNAA
jgi:hypothetical protein